MEGLQDGGDMATRLATGGVLRTKTKRKPGGGNRDELRRPVLVAGSGCATVL